MEYLGIEIGTHRLRCLTYDNILFDEPSVLVMDNDKVIAIGNEAEQQLGQYEIQSINEQNIIAYLDVLWEQMPPRLLQKRSIFFTTPHSFSKECNDAIQQYYIKKGAQEVVYDTQSWCAAIGAQLNIEQKNPTTLWLVGHSECTITTFYDGKIYSQQTLALAGKQVDAHLRNQLLQNGHLQVSDTQIRTLKEQIGTCHTTAPLQSMQIYGP